MIHRQLTLLDAISVTAPRLLVSRAVNAAISTALMNSQIIPTIRPGVVFGVLSPYLKKRNKNIKTEFNFKMLGHRKYQCPGEKINFLKGIGVKVSIHFSDAFNCVVRN